MESQLYIRIRGRVLGPYDREKLQALARRGQLSRMHELSPDATSWVRASTYPELFTLDDAARGTLVPEGTPERLAVPIAPDVQPPLAAARRWWYRKNNAEAGPVEEAALQQMLASAILGPDDMVWTDGMPQWMPARAAGLMPTLYTPLATQPGSAGTGTLERSEELPASLCKSATTARSWALFIAVAYFIFAGLFTAAGILFLIQGANHHLTPVVAWGLFALIFAIDLAVGGCLLSTYANRSANLNFSKHPMVLEKSLDTLRSFWIYTSINLIVILAFLLSAIIWWIAIIGTFPWSELK
jgi:hypothetical protein